MTECEHCNKEIDELAPLYEVDDEYICAKCYQAYISNIEYQVEEFREINKQEVYSRV